MGKRGVFLGEPRGCRLQEVDTPSTWTNGGNVLKLNCCFDFLSEPTAREELNYAFIGIIS